MNGFSTINTAQRHCRQLLALAVTSWLSLASASGLIAQETEAPTAPPAIPSEAAPSELFVPPAKVVPVKPLVRRVAPRSSPRKAITQLIPTGTDSDDVANAKRGTGRFGETTELIPTDVQRADVLVKSRPAPKSAAWSKAEEAETEPTIRQVQAESVASESLVPGDGLGEAAPQDAASTVPILDPGSDAAGNGVLDPPAIEEGTFTEPSTSRAAPAEPATSLDDAASEPAPLNDRIGHPQRMPSHINRTAAVDAAPYNDQANGRGFGTKDAIHTVASGESFWSISKKHYKLGRYSAALAEYNKSRNPKADKIKPGMKIVIPPVQTLEHKFAHLISGMSTPATGADAATPVKTGFFVDANGQAMYRVGDGDTLSSIAEAHLGRSSRWTQIVALNKQTLPNPDALKLGMVLHLPQDASDAIQGR